MLHEIKTTDYSTLNIMKVKVENIEGTEKQQDQIYISITDTSTNSCCITKQSAMELANKLLSIATSIKTIK